jgi:uncharacterized membrane protein YeiB
VSTQPEATPRVIDLDVIRAVALIGVCVLNYHGYLIIRGGRIGDSILDRAFHPWHGPLSTRFAAVFVVVAGMGVALLSRRSLASRDPVAISADRWMLIRRGVLLFTFGFFLDWVWPGTILFFYGAYFLAAACIFTLRSRWLVLIGASAAVAAGGVHWWVVERRTQGRPPDWLTDGNATATRSPRDLVLDTFVRGTHPLLPWLAFLCLGIVLGRMLPFSSRRRVELAGLGAALIVLGYGLHSVLPWNPELRSTAPFDRGTLYVVATVGSSLVAVSVIGWLAERTAGRTVTQMLAVTGRCTLTLYVLHVLVFNLLVDWLGWIHPGGLTTALLFGLLFWLFAITAANAWYLWQPVGPLEWVYRRFSGSLR